MGYLYMQVTQDRLELPVAVAGSIAELAKMTGKSQNNISATMHYDKKTGRRSRYVKVECDKLEGDADESN
mgnify:FL=1